MTSQNSDLGRYLDENPFSTDENPFSTAENDRVETCLQQKRSKFLFSSILQHLIEKFQWGPALNNFEMTTNAKIPV